MIKDEISADSNSDEVPDEGESNWYYFDSDGTAAYLNSKAANMSKATTKIDGSSYFFNAYGVRQTGLIISSPLQAKILPDILVKMILTER